MAREAAIHDYLQRQVIAQKQAIDDLRAYAGKQGRPVPKDGTNISNLANKLIMIPSSFRPEFTGLAEKVAEHLGQPQEPPTPITNTDAAFIISANAGQRYRADLLKQLKETYKLDKKTS